MVWLLKFYLWPFGRVSRLGMWVGALIIPTMINLAIMGFIFYQYKNGSAFAQPLILQSAPLSFLTNVVFYWVYFALGAKRFHDIGWSGYIFVIVQTVMIASIYLAVFSGFNENLPGVLTENLGVPELVNKIPSGLFGVLFPIILIIGIANFWLLYVTPGNLGANKYGPDPLGER